MIAKLSEITACFFVSKSIINEDDKEVYSYGMELLFSTIFNLLIALCIAVITHTFIEMSVFLTTFIILRQYIGGYHANTHMGCMTIFTFVLLSFVLLQKNIPQNYEIIISTICISISSLLILKLAPVEHPNKPLSDDDKIRLRKRALISLIVVTLVISILLFTSSSYAVYISLGIFTSSTAMLFGMLKESRVKIK